MFCSIGIRNTGCHGLIFTHGASIFEALKTPQQPLQRHPPDKFNIMAGFVIRMVI